MATNDFLPFAGGAGANTIDQATYASLPSRSTGFTAGVAQSAQLNKVWRQSSIIAAAVAQYIADLTGNNVVDDGTTSAITAGLEAIVRTARLQRFNASGSFTVPPGVTRIFISGCSGGGGGGGGGGTVGNSSVAGAGGGGGGGAGEPVIRFAVNVTPGMVIPFVIGAGGNGGSGGQSSSNISLATGANGGDGAATVFGSAGTVGPLSFQIGRGGNGGQGLASNSGSLQGGAGGPGGAGLPNGSSGTDGSLVGNGGVGASGAFGGGGGAGRGGTQGQIAGTTTGGDAYNFGAGGGGGGGAYGTSGSVGSSGGKGAPGFLIIEW